MFLRLQSQEEAAGLALQITELQRQLNDAGDQLSSARNELARGMSMRGELELMLQDTRAAQAQVGLGHGVFISTRPYRLQRFAARRRPWASAPDSPHYLQLHYIQLVSYQGIVESCG